MIFFAVRLSFNKFKIQREKRHETFATFYYFEYHWGSSTRLSSKSTKIAYGLAHAKVRKSTFTPKILVFVSDIGIILNDFQT